MYFFLECKLINTNFIFDAQLDMNVNLNMPKSMLYVCNIKISV